MLNRGLLKMNLYIWMVAAMTIACIIWDATFYMELYDFTNAHGNVYPGLCGMFGTSAALWNFFIVAMVYWTSISANKDYHATNMSKGVYLKMLTVLNTFLSAATATYMYMADVAKAWAAYDVVRLSIAGMSFLVLVALLQKLYRTTTPENRHLSPLYHLIRKLALYPLGNILSRLPTIPYDMVYGVSLNDFPREAGAMQKVVLMLFVTLTPSCGIIDLLVFIKMQNGWEPLVEMFTCPSAKDITLKMERENEIRQSRSSTTKGPRRIRSSANTRRISSDPGSLYDDRSSYGASGEVRDSASSAGVALCWVLEYRYS